MCGLVGFLDPRAGMAQQALDATAGDTATTFVSRGPDGRGVWADGAAGVALAPGVAAFVAGGKFSVRKRIFKTAAALRRTADTAGPLFPMRCGRDPAFAG